ncbi:MAG: DNA translocase FtsK [Lachnospiraceae bacterium]|nr:DNA translocase FtsK [Lachnospiraceae bacterium]
MATTGTRKKSTKRRTQTRKSKKKQEEFRNEVILWTILAICIILFISNLGFGGIVGGKVSAFFFGVFGLVSYIFPICLFVGSAFVISNQSNKKKKIAGIKLFSGIFFMFFLCLLLQLLTDKEEVYSAAAAFSYAAANKSGGGFVGGLLEALFAPNFGVIGTYVITIAGLIITTVLLTEKSLLSPVKKGGKVIYDNAREDAIRRREIRESRREEDAIRREEQKKRRIDKKAVGVAIDTTVRPKSKTLRKSDEVKELIPEKNQELPHIQSKTDIPVSPVSAALPPQEDVFEHMTITCDEPDLMETYTEEPTYTYEEPAGMREITPDFSDDSDNLYDEYEDIMPESDENEDFISYEEAEEPAIMAEPEVPAAAPAKNAKQSEAEISENVAQIEDEIQKKQEEKKYVFPPVSLLKPKDAGASGDSKAYLQETAAKLQQTLKNFGVNVTITNVSCGPTVTRYELQPEMGVKVSKIVNLSDDIKLNLAAADIRIEAPIPGKAAIGIEVPNKKSVPVMFRELIESEEFKNSTSGIAFAAGKDIGGKVIVADIAKMPHLLIAGATGSGKSVCINTIIMSILYKAHPNDVKLIMIDPKVVELSVYNGIPHLLIPVVTDPKKAAGALHWAVTEMTERYQKFAEYNVRDIKGYNKKVEGIADIEDENKPQKMPQIVIIVDELADLMMVAPGDVEDAICRLAQLARAAGIHLVIATQRPSVNVITGLIKANMPSRIAFSVTSGVDSRTILDMNGAEKLLGKGDMLFYPQGLPKPIRAQGAFVSDKEVSDVVEFLTENNGTGTYDSSVEEKMNTASENPTGVIDSGMPTDEKDSYFLEAARLLVDKEKGSIGMLQRYLKVGFNRAARIMDQLEEAGIVGPEEGTKPRKVLMNEAELENYIEECL